MIRNLIFDVGNVLAGFHWKDYLKAFGFEPEKEEAIANALFAGPLWKELDRAAVPIDELKEKFAALAPMYRNDVLTVFEQSHNCIQRYDYAIPWIRELKKKNLNVYYLSNYSELMVKRTIDKLDFLPLMDGGLFSYEVQQVKPDEEIYHSLLLRYPEIIPEESVFFDDTAVNIETARRLGFHGIQFHTKDQAEADLAELLKTLS